MAALDKSLPLEYQSEQSRLNILGFWIFLGAEIMLFATLFASYLVLAGRTADGPTPAQLFELKTLLIQTLLLLTSSFTCGIVIHEMRKHNQKQCLMVRPYITFRCRLPILRDRRVHYVYW